MTKEFTKEKGFDNHFFLDKKRLKKIVDIILANGDKRGIQTKVEIVLKREPTEEEKKVFSIYRNLCSINLR